MIGLIRRNRARKTSKLSLPRKLESCPEIPNTTDQNVESVIRIKKAQPSWLDTDFVVAETDQKTDRMSAATSAPIAADFSPAPETKGMGRATTATTTTMTGYVEALTRTLANSEETCRKEEHEEEFVAKEQPYGNATLKTTPTARRIQSREDTIMIPKLAVSDEVKRVTGDTLTSLSTVVGTAVTSTEETDTGQPRRIDVDSNTTIRDAAVPGSLIQHFIDEYLVCRIHNGVFHILAHIPRLLACGHTFCETCLRDIALDGAIIVCPVCGRVTGLPPDGVKGLPEDFYTASLCVRVVDLLEDNSLQLHADISYIDSESGTTEDVVLTNPDVPSKQDREYFVTEVESFVVIDEVPPKQNPSDGQVGLPAPETSEEKTPRLTASQTEKVPPSAKQRKRSARRLKIRKKGFRSLPSILDKFMGDVDGKTKLGLQNGPIIDSFNMPWV